MIYLDTGCLLKLYYPEPNSASVAATVSGKVIIFTALHELESWARRAFFRMARRSDAIHRRAFPRPRWAP